MVDQAVFMRKERNTTSLFKGHNDVTRIAQQPDFRLPRSAWMASVEHSRTKSVGPPQMRFDFMH